MKIIYVDVELYKNYFLLGIMSEDGKIVQFEMYDGHPLDVQGIYKVLQHHKAEMYTFNGNNYDIPIIRHALAGANNAQLKSASNAVIEGGLKPWDFEKKFKCAPLTINHVDLIEVAPGMVGLKTYAGRLHCAELEDLPFHPDDEITPEMRAKLRTYNIKDLKNTRTMRQTMAEQISLRVTMAEQMKIELANETIGRVFPVPDLRSKSDAQIAEAVLKQRVFLHTGGIPRKLSISYNTFQYKPPSYIKFMTHKLQQAMKTITEATLEVVASGHVKMPKEIDSLMIEIGAMKYKLGVGGLHSQEKEVSHYADDIVYLRDIDVVSYYPNLMLNMGMYPEAMGPTFLTAYRDILDERVDAKRNGDKVKDKVLKIVLNGTFGKTASRYSVLYNPKMMVATTLTGQLSILMLIEMLEHCGIPVISANTDGIVVKCPRNKEADQRAIVAAWERRTNLTTEETNYVSIHSRDVNSYIAIKTDKSIKGKGFFALPEKAFDRLAKSPQNEICVEAVIEYLKNGTPIADTVNNCRDLTKFTTLRNVTGGAVKDGEKLGKVVRWYYSTKVTGTINYASNGNIVPRSAKAAPILNLPEDFPDDVDFEWYTNEAEELLCDIGKRQRKVLPKLPRRGTKLWKEYQAQGLVEVDEYGTPRWAGHADDVIEWHRSMTK